MSYQYMKSFTAYWNAPWNAPHSTVIPDHGKRKSSPLLACLCCATQQRYDRQDQILGGNMQKVCRGTLVCPGSVHYEHKSGKKPSAVPRRRHTHADCICPPAE